MSSIEAPAEAEPSRIDHSQGAPARIELAVRHLSHSHGELATIDDLGLEVGRGEVLGLVGPSGCGKSTLLELIAGLREPGAGEIAVAGETAAAERLGRCAYMPQDDALLPWYSALDNAALGLRNKGASRREARDQAAALFERFGLGGFQGFLPQELSGGMRQRLAFLRTLLPGKPLLCLDEPFASLDAITRGEMQEWLAEALLAEARTVVLVTHDIEEALYLADSVVVLSSRPARALATLSAPRPRSPNRASALTDPAFVAARERAMALLREGSR